MLRIDGPWDGIATLTLDRPERKNALSIELRDRISDVLDALAADEAVRVVVHHRRRRRLLGRLRPPGVRSRDRRPGVRRAALGVERPLPPDGAAVPAADRRGVNGPAIAGGFDLAVMCDLRVASKTATFSHPEVTFGDVVYAPLHDLVGGAVARDLCFTGRKVDADGGARAPPRVERRAGEGARRSATAEIAAQIARVPRELLLRHEGQGAAPGRRSPSAGTLDL